MSFPTIIVMSQNKGKERENSYQKLKRSPEERHMETKSIYFDCHRRLSQSLESECNSNVNDMKCYER